MDQWNEPDRLTLTLAPLWVLSALCGRCRFDQDERDAFWDGLTTVATTAEGLAREVLSAMAADRRWLFDEFELDGRSIVSGLTRVSALLDGVGVLAGDEVRACVLRVGQQFARARGPFGRRITTQDEQTLLLCTQLLESSQITLTHNPLNSELPI